MLNHYPAADLIVPVVILSVIFEVCAHRNVQLSIFFLVFVIQLNGQVQIGERHQSAEDRGTIRTCEL
jgi:hypothetical protein